MLIRVTAARVKMTNTDRISKEIEGKVENLARPIMIHLAKEAQKEMANYVKNNVKRKPNDGNLEATILNCPVSVQRTREYFKSSTGNILNKKNEKRYIVSILQNTFMNRHAKYWFVVNYGKMFPGTIPFIPPPALGLFADGTKPMKGTARNQRFWAGGRGNGVGLINPQKPIRPLHYIEHGLSYFKKKVKKALQKSKVNK